MSSERRQNSEEHLRISNQRPAQNPPRDGRGRERAGGGRNGGASVLAEVQQGIRTGINQRASLGLWGAPDDVGGTGRERHLQEEEDGLSNEIYCVLQIDETRGLVLNRPANRLVTRQPARLHACLKMARALNLNVARRASAQLAGA